MQSIDPKIQDLVQCWDAQRSGQMLARLPAQEVVRVDGLLSQVANPEDLKSLISQGLKSRIGSTRGRKDALSVLTQKVIDGLVAETGKKSKVDDIIKALWRFDSPDEWSAVIQEISGEDEKIYWIDSRGKERETSFAAFRKRLQRLDAMR